MMANPRRNSYTNHQSSDSPIFQNPSSHAHSTSSRIIHFLKKPHAFPFLLTIFLFLTWLSLKLQHSSHYLSSPFSRSQQALFTYHTLEDDAKVNLVRFSSGFPSPLAKDNRGWILDPIAFALCSNLLGMPTILSSSVSFIHDSNSIFIFHLCILFNFLCLLFDM
jgi:hypothetical protein